MSTSFNDLLQRAEELSTGLESASELPHVQKSFQQLLDAGQRLCQKTTHQQDDMQVKASLLLSSKGQDIPKISDRIKSLTAVEQNIDQIPIHHETDIEGYLQAEHENAILSVVEQQKWNCFREVDERRWKGMMSSWETEKQMILKKIGGSDGTLSFVQEVAAQRNLDTSEYYGNTSMQPSVMNPWELAYADQVKSYNDSVISGRTSQDLTKLCSNAAEKMKDVAVNAMWSMVKYITEPANLLDSFNQGPPSKDWLKHLTGQSLKYLEESYKEYMQSTVYSSPHLAQLGGIPSSLNLVKSFLKIIAANLSQVCEDGQVDGLPVWSIIFYCLRCGDLTTVADFVQSQQHLFPDFNTWIQEYCSTKRQLSTSSKHKMKIHYKRTVRTSTDVYKIAVYCIVGKFDFTDAQQEVVKKTEDYLWFKLSQVDLDVDASNSGPEDLSLLQLQKLLSVNYGESHFNASSNPTLYFQVLFLTCQFEAAVEFLSRFDNFLSHAVHIALSLHVNGILNTSSVVHSKLLSEANDDNNLSMLRQVNLVRFVMLYTQKFELSDPCEAINYFYFLRDIRSEGQSLFAHCLSELVHETGEFEKLLGRLKADGTRQPGVVDRYFPDTNSLIAKVAANTEDKGLSEDAIHLYDLCGDADRVLTLLNRLLGKVVCKSDDSNPDRSRLKLLAIGIAERYRVQSMESAATLRSTFHLLLDLASFFDLYHAGKVEQALDIMRELQMIPSTAEQVQEKARAFKTYSDEIRQNMADVLLAVMNLLAKRCARAPETLKRQLRENGRSLIVFAGMLPYQLPANTTSSLVKLEVQMN